MASFEEMDKAANEAEKELSYLTDEQLAVVSIWFTKNYMNAGHKRLGRILVQEGKRLMKEPNMMKLYEDSKI